jgi:hypothetical protein
LEDAGWTEIPRTDHESYVRPDLFLNKGPRSRLFEFKPEASFNAVMMGIGQLICYAEHLKPQAKILVIPETVETADYFSGVQNVCRSHGIEIAFFRGGPDEFEFTDLKKLIN